MARRTFGSVVTAMVLWLIIAGVLGAAFKYMVYPRWKEKRLQQTGSSSQYKSEVVLAADAFSGYCILRSDEMAQRLKTKGIKLTVVDDGADYMDRIRKLKDGKIQMAAFPVNSLVKTGAALGEFPASIAYIIDETKGADAIVAYESAIASLGDLNSEDARIVYTPDSPSELLGQVVVANFSLQRMPKDWGIEEDGAAKIYKQFCAAPKNEKRAYVLWEPYVTMALEQPGAKVLLDSSKLKGYIIDALVVNREFLVDHYDVVKEVVEAYCRTLYAYSHEGRMVDLVMEDAKNTGSERLSKEKAERLVQGIQWKNVLENYAHFGLLLSQEAHQLEHIEDSIDKITDVLVETGAIKSNPFVGSQKSSALFFDKILRDMKADQFHPGKESTLLSDIDVFKVDDEEIRTDKELVELNDQQWESLMPVGELRVEPIQFGRASSQISLNSDRVLQDLAQKLNSWPQYYLMVVGQARPEGDAEANKELAKARADSVVEFLVGQGVNKARIQTKSRIASVKGGESQTVMFVVGQLPY